MPYKRKQDYNNFMRQYMKVYRKQQKQAMKQLKIKYPKVFNEIFGKQKGGRKK